MMLDNFFSMLGHVWTTAVLLAVLVVVGSPAIGAVLFSSCSLRHLQPRNR